MCNVFNIGTIVTVIFPRRRNYGNFIHSHSNFCSYMYEHTCIYSKVVLWFMYFTSIYTFFNLMHDLGIQEVFSYNLNAGKPTWIFYWLLWIQFWWTYIYLLNWLKDIHWKATVLFQWSRIKIWHLTAKESNNRVFYQKHFPIKIFWKEISLLY